uniref:Uncharacterized protein n=1 Tax=Arundo donax TaxID=35708 RepID=A0A0A9H378_ARUDO
MERRPQGRQAEQGLGVEALVADVEPLLRESVHLAEILLLPGTIKPPDLGVEVREDVARDGPVVVGQDVRRHDVHGGVQRELCEGTAAQVSR